MRSAVAVVTDVADLTEAGYVRKWAMNSSDFMVAFAGGQLCGVRFCAKSVLMRFRYAAPAALPSDWSSLISEEPRAKKPFAFRASAFARNVLTLISPGAAPTGTATNNAIGANITEFRCNLNVLPSDVEDSYGDTA